MTIAERMADPRHGFDWLRLIFATGVMVWHSACLSRFTQPAILNEQWASGLASLCVPGFFAASGFLVAASAARNGVLVFYAYRVARVIPGLAVVVALTAFVLGPLVTSLPLGAYTANLASWLYGLDAFGLNYQYLPGVFQGRYFTEVNGSLWTIGLELACYFWLGQAAVLGLLRRRIIVGILAVMALVALSTIADLNTVGRLGAHRPLMVVCFILGAGIYVWRDGLPYSLALGLICAGVAAALNITGHVDLSALPWTYAVVVVGLADFPRLRVDLSYGVYLAAFPIQQVIASFTWGQAWWSNLLVAGPLAFTYAALSWRLIEAPALRSKAWLKRMLSRSLLLGPLRSRRSMT